jgi:hypothetical protein
MLTQTNMLPHFLESFSAALTRLQRGRIEIANAHAHTKGKSTLNTSQPRAVSKNTDTAT